jgi:hypothetical protein
MRHTPRRSRIAVAMAMACLLVLLALLGTSTVKAEKTIMPWMCLQRCNFTSGDIHAHMEQLVEHKTFISAVTFEIFNLGPNGELVFNKDLMQVSLPLHKLGFRTFGMISSFPYPPQFLDWMRELFARPEAFFQACIAQAKAHRLTGFNVDFEPTGKATHADAVAYAAFLSRFADALHPVGLELSVDVGSWSNVWDWKLLGESRVDTVCLMSTYTGNTTFFESALTRAVAEIGLDKLGVGLENINPNTKKPFSKAEMEDRFQLISKSGATQIDIWDMPIPELWFPMLEAWHGKD